MAKDAVLDAAVDLAREVAVSIAEDPADVGEYLGATSEGDRLVSHRFASNARGYRGWAWTVTVARVPRGRTATVSEAELLPGPDAVLARAWVPWSERLRPGDIGPGDVLPFRPDDPRLEPGWTPSGDDEVDQVAIGELALARARILSPEGRDQVAERWYRGPQGPTSAGSLASAAACASCGFLVPLQGALGQVFGVCANEWSPDDGNVVSVDHGCGAHSETDVDPTPSEWPDPEPLLDDLRLEVAPPARSAEEPASGPAVEEVQAVAADDEGAAVTADDEGAAVPAPDEEPVADAAASDEQPDDGQQDDEQPADEPSSDEQPADELPVDEDAAGTAAAEVPQPDPEPDAER